MYKNIKILLISNNQNNLLEIYDKNDNIIKKTSIKDKYIFYGKINETYKIKLFTDNLIFNTGIYICEKYDKPYIFDIRNKKKYHQIFIFLKDKNYKNLKIEKGMIKIWQSNTI